MNRLGWAILVLILLGAAAFALMVRPAAEAPPGAPAPAPAPVPATATAAAPPPRAGLIVPVDGVARQALVDSWGDPRGGGTRGHQALDIPAPVGTPVRAAAAGTVEKLFDSTDGGRTLYIRSPDRRTVYYYAHLDGYAPGLGEGGYVAQGQPIATVGATGDANPQAPHLHFEVKVMGAGERWWQGREINPYPLLAGNAGRR